MEKDLIYPKFERSSQEEESSKVETIIPSAPIIEDRQFGI